MNIRRPWRLLVITLSVFVLWNSVSQADEADELFKLRDQVQALHAAGNYKPAAALGEQLVARAENVFADRPVSLARCLTCLEIVYKAQSRLAEAEPLCKRALALSERALGPEHSFVAVCVNNLAALYAQQGRLAEAEPLFKRALAIKEKTLDPENPEIAVGLQNLGNIYNGLGRYAEAEPLFKRALAIQEKAFGKEHPTVADTLNLLAVHYDDQARFAEAELLYKRALTIWEKALGKDHPNVAIGLNNLANLYHEQSRNTEAEPLYKRALVIREKVLGNEHPYVASSLGNLANLYVDQGQYADAEPLYKRVLAIFEKALGTEHLDVAKCLNNLAAVYSKQGRSADSEPLCKRALAIREKVLGMEHPDVATGLNNLATVYYEQKRYVEAEPLYKRALAIKEKTWGGEHPSVALGLNNLARLYAQQGHYAEADSLYKRALAMAERAMDRGDSELATSFCLLSDLYNKQGRYAEAEPLIDRAIVIQDLAGDAAGDRSNSYLLRAQVKWKRDKRSEALADLNQALLLAEQQRTQSSGGEQERPQAFSQFGEAYEQMVAWQTELGDVSAAMAAVERSRARSLMDQMSAAHIELLAGVPVEQAQPLRAKEAAAQTQIASVEKRLELLQSRQDLSSAEREKQIMALQKELVVARQAYADAFAAIRNASPAYRQMVGQNFKPATLDELQVRLSGDDRLVLEYVLGSEAGYLLVIPPQGQKARIEKLTLTEEQAKKMGVKAGPLTAGVMKQIMANESETGVLQLLRDDRKSAQAFDQLAILWQALVPENERESITSGKLKQLIVIPDGPLTLLPFDTLVVETGESPRCLLDAGPPVVSAPSATLLYNLMNPSLTKGPESKQPVLSVGDPSYQGVASKTAADRGGSAMNQLTARSRYGTLRGTLSNLPNSGLESEWVTEVFKQQGIAAGRLTKEKATEANVRFNIANRRIIHLACHGLADQSHGNLFGALAFTPGPQGAANPADDGFLTLAEIYELNLRGTELSILSACDTNFGPNQKGEGTWSLSRGFLVAGSKRVIASNWLVDDEAGASLVSVFCSDITKEREHMQLDYAASLQAAKRWVRNQEKWRSPYYWGTFVLVGPN